MTAVEKHQLKARNVAFDMSNSPLHWIPDDVDSSHLINGIHLLLPAGELWFCRVFNQALPLITDDALKQEVRGFVRQEASHAKAHREGERWLEACGIDVEAVRGRADNLFVKLLSDKPFGVIALPEMLKKRWLITRVGLVAAIEHFTGFLGDWCMNSDGWDEADPVVTDLFRWHLAEEVEHRSVAFDLFEHLCQTRLGFYVSRQALMAAVFPLFIYFMADDARGIAQHDSHPDAQRMANGSVLRLLWNLEKLGRTTGHTPTFSFLVKRTLHWVAPRFNPRNEGDTQQALDYIARSPAALAGVQKVA